MTLTLDGAVELAIVERNGMDESRHLGAAVVLDPDGWTILALGDPTAVVWPRSTQKPFMALAVRRAGTGLDTVATALSTSSHVGTPAHVAVVERMLHAAGLDADALRCPSAYPLDPASARAASGPSRLYYNCSGKHAGLLAATVHLGADPGAYLELSHPIESAALGVVEELTGEHVRESGLDGCGAPVHAVSLGGLARGIGRLARDPDGGAILDAVLAEPWTVEGPGRTDTVVAETCGVFLKDAAEGMLVAVAPNGTSLALKILDGSSRPAARVALTLLARVGALDADVAQHAAERVTERVLGGPATVVGRIRVADAVAGA